MSEDKDFDPVDSYLNDPGYWKSHWQSYEDDYDAVCKTCAYRIEEHSYPINSKKPPKIRHLCTRRSNGTFGECMEVNLNGFCRYYKPSNPPKDDKLEIVYHGHTVVLSNTTDGIRVEIKEKKDE